MTHVLHLNCSLNTRAYGVDPSTHAEEVERLVLLSDRVFSVDLRALPTEHMSLLSMPGNDVIDHTGTTRSYPDTLASSSEPTYNFLQYMTYVK